MGGTGQDANGGNDADGGGGGGGWVGGSGGGGGQCVSNGAGGGGGAGASYAESSATGVSISEATSLSPEVVITATIAAPPSASITTPANGATYSAGQTVDANYSCTEGSQGTGIQSCSGPVADGAAIDTSTPGPHSFTVTATSSDGLTGSQTATYTVIATPSFAATVDDGSSGQPWSGTETVGTTAYDTATVTGVQNYPPTGTVTYNSFVGGTCSGSPSATDTVTLHSGTVPNSSPTLGLAAGHYSFQASYSGDSEYHASSGSCQPFTVQRASGHLATTVQDGGSAWSGNETVGAKADAAATLASVTGFTPSGTVTYSRFANATCQGGAVGSEAVEVGGDGTVPDGGSTSALAAGTYSYQASYSGDTEYQPQTSTCVTFVVLKAASVTTAAVHDAASGNPWSGQEAAGASAYGTASVSGVSGFTPTGTVTYSLFSDGSCTGMPVTEQVSLGGDGTVPPSAETPTLPAGDYSYQVTYAGDRNYSAAASACAPFSVAGAASAAPPNPGGSGTSTPAPPPSTPTANGRHATATSSPSCPAPSGSLQGAALGQVRLGMTRAAARRAYSHVSRTATRSHDVFCLTPTGITVGYATRKLLGRAHSARSRLLGRVILLLTSNPYYTLDGVRPGDAAVQAVPRLGAGHLIQISGVDWYLARHPGVTAVVVIRGGYVTSVGIASSRFTAGKRAQRALVRSA